MKKHTKMINLKYQLRHGIQRLNYLMGHILYQIFNIVLNISLKDHEAVADNLETEDKINITIKNDVLFSSTKRSNIYKGVMDFCLLLKIWVKILVKI